ncbi:MAG: bifunctional proline dehydrogenase/L-glutamate gamma-semialdehyde dehydrogenase PutA [Caulobacterales bacterium]
MLASFPGFALDWDALDLRKYADEDREVASLLEEAPLGGEARTAVQAQARAIVERARGLKRRKGMMESFLEEFGLSNAEGLALMCLAEALLRVPDAATADKLIAEKIKDGRWDEHLGKADHWLVNASTWGLMLTGRIASVPPELRDLKALMARFAQRVGEPVVRSAAMQAMRILGEQFVLGRTIEEALRRGKSQVRSGDVATFSFDMLGEGARTDDDAARYLRSYADAIEAVGQPVAPSPGPAATSGLSVKLSALHPRYEARNEAQVMEALLPRVLQLAQAARRHDVHLCLDAEEADRLALSLKLLDRLTAEPSLAGWSGLGLAVQAYQKRGRDVVAQVAALARARDRRLMVRLVKGAYWDGEVKRAQMAGRSDFPVFTTKSATDASYLACAAIMLRNGDVLYPQFATHNAHTAAAIAFMAQEAGVQDYEFQRLHGMGEALYAAAGLNKPVRVYAPVGGHEDLLPYLVRRLLENGANTSFVNTFLDDDVSPDLVAADPLAKLEAQPHRHPRLPPPSRLFGPSRLNSTGEDMSIMRDRASLEQAVAALDAGAKPHAAPIVAGAVVASGGVEVRDPAQAERVVGFVQTASADHIQAAISAAHAFQPRWDGCGARERARILRACGDALEAARASFVALIAREAGRTLQDGIDEVRETVDFCRYYAAQAERLMAEPERLPGPAGETNALHLTGRGVFACIAPWNFPLAIFVGQIAAALAAGNTVVAKPAEQTPLIAFEAVRLMHAAGVPFDALHLLPGDGSVGAGIVGDERVVGVAFTGSTETARRINQNLAARPGAIATLIAETGGMNGMFVDTTALKEQVVDDVMVSAFGSAGQRCSALRVLFLPEATADGILETLAGALAALKLGDPGLAVTDVGPVIDRAAQSQLKAHIETMAGQARIVAHAQGVPESGCFVAPTIIELKDLDQLTGEVFGPILHVVRYNPADVGAMASRLAAKGYGLTLGVHSRLDSFADAVAAAVPAGNVYINRSMIGAVVGVQPFGGRGLSGTGPKAGGPHYLPRFATERTMTVNIAAQGGDPALLNL